MEIYGGYPTGGGTTPDPVTNQTILSGDIIIPGNSTDNSYHVVTIDASITNAVLDGFTIQDGNAGLASGTDDRGGWCLY